ncbi:MAG: DUF3108 domain-containing protein [Nitratireductor sp.]
MKDTGLRFTCLLALLASLGPTNSSRAEQIQQNTVLSVRFSGIPVGTANFNIQLNGQHYEVNANGKTAGIVDMFAPGSGEAKSEGAVKPDTILTSTNQVVFSGKDEKATLDMTFVDGAVEKVALKTNKPKDKSGPKWVPVKPEDLKAVIDPASTLVIPVPIGEANDGRKVCNRTLNIYDGDARYNMALTYKRTQPVKTDGYRGYAYVCKLKYIPIAGHKTGQKNIKYMAANEGMELWLAPIAKRPVFTVIRVEVPTWLGQVTALPVKFVSSIQ